MKKRLVRIEPHAAGKTLGALYFLMGLLFIPMFVLAGITTPDARTLPWILMAVAVPFIYGGMGYVLVAIGAAVFNQICRFTGGLEFTVEPVAGAQ